MGHTIGFHQKTQELVSTLGVNSIGRRFLSYIRHFIVHESKTRGLLNAVV